MSLSVNSITQIRKTSVFGDIMKYITTLNLIIFWYFIILNSVLNLKFTKTFNFNSIFCIVN
jgi:hypothetical protein